MKSEVDSSYAHLNPPPDPFITRTLEQLAELSTQIARANCTTLPGLERLRKELRATLPPLRVVT